MSTVHDTERDASRRGSRIDCGEGRLPKLLVPVASALSRAGSGGTAQREVPSPLATPSPVLNHRSYPLLTLGGECTLHGLSQTRRFHDRIVRVSGSLSMWVFSAG